MADKGAMRIYTELPSWAKGIVVVGGIAIGYIAVTSIINAIRGKAQKEKQEQEVNNAKSELQKEINSGNKPTLSRSTLEAMSNAVVSASNDCGTKNNLLLSQFDNLKNQADMLLFIDVFGLRKKTRCPFSDDTRENFMSSQTPPMSLSAIVSSELSSSQINSLNNKLTSKGISYKF